MKSEKKHYGMVDVLRLVFAILVVAIHTMAFQSVNENLKVATSMGICRIAVPFFFVVSGYFLYNRIKVDKEPKNTLKRLLKLYFIWVAIELIVLLPFTIAKIKAYPIWIGIKSIFILGGTGSLWYISSLIMAVFLCAPLLKKDKVGPLLIIGLALYLFGATGDTYYGFFNNDYIEMYSSIFFMPQIGITESIFFLALGCAVNKFSLKDKINKSGLLSVLAIILVLIETFILNKTGIAKDANMYLSVIFAAPLILIWALNYKKEISSEKAKVCREYSLGIYCVHQIIMVWISIFITNSMIIYLLTLGISFLVVTLIRKTKLRRVLLR